jgi:MerR family transcriptional regulator, Zn(II)-responsive regulator of zntA
MNVSELARKANTTSETVRHYTDIELLRPTRNPDNHYRQYSHDDLRRLNFALQARSLGFTLTDIRLLVDESESGVSPCATTRQLIEQRLDEVNHRIEELHRLSHRMRGALTAWETHPDCAGGDERICALIESFTDDDTPSAHQEGSNNGLSELEERTHA